MKNNSWLELFFNILTLVFNFAKTFSWAQCLTKGNAKLLFLHLQGLRNPFEKKNVSAAKEVGGGREGRKEMGKKGDKVGKGVQEKGKVKWANDILFLLYRR